MRLLVGLGNPGDRYAGHRHNIGFRAVDAIARVHAAAPWRRGFEGRAAEATIAGEKVVLLKPDTFMNESGRAVGAAKRFFKLDLADIAVFHDELDLVPGKLRVKTGGGDSGHNGLRSITALCGGGYRRVRMGIGHPGHKDLVHGYVLRDFAKSEAGWVDALVRASADHVALLLSGDDAGFQNKVHLAMEAAGWDGAKRVGERD